MMSTCDVVVLALYPEANIKFVKNNLDRFKAGQLLTDVSGVKRTMVAAIESLLPKTVDYVSHHPMAGSENPGFDARDRTLFRGANAIVITTPNTRNDPVDRLKKLLETIGFSTIKEATPERHDAFIALTSQLPHALAMALMKGSDVETLDFAGNSFKDLTRIASINAPMWSELFLSNKEYLIEELHKMSEELLLIAQYLKTDDATALTRYMEASKEKRDVYGNHQD